MTDKEDKKQQQSLEKIKDNARLAIDGKARGSISGAVLDQKDCIMLVVRGQVVFAEAMENFQELRIVRTDDDKIAAVWKGPMAQQPRVVPVRMMPTGPLIVRPDAKKTPF